MCTTFEMHLEYTQNGWKFNILYKRNNWNAPFCLTFFKKLKECNANLLCKSIFIFKTFI